MEFPDFYQTYGYNLQPVIKYALMFCALTDESIVKGLTSEVLNTRILPALVDMIIRIANGAKCVPEDIKDAAIEKCENTIGQVITSLPIGDVLALEQFIENIKAGRKQS